MWSLEIAVVAPSVQDVDQLAEIAGLLLDELEQIAGDVAPVVSGQYSEPDSLLAISVDLATDEPTAAVAEALRLIYLAADRAMIVLGSVQTISLNAIDDLQQSLGRVSA